MQTNQQQPEMIIIGNERIDINNPEKLKEVYDKLRFYTICNPSLTDTCFKQPYVSTTGVSKTYEHQIGMVLHNINDILSMDVIPCVQIQECLVSRNGSYIKDLINKGICPNERVQQISVLTSNEAVKILHEAGIEMSKKTLLTAIQSHIITLPYILKNIKHDSTFIRYVLEDNLFNIAYINDATEDIMRIFVDICLNGKLQNSFNAAYKDIEVVSETEKTHVKQLFANWYVYNYLKNPSERVQQIAVQINPYVVKHMIDKKCTFNQKFLNRIVKEGNPSHIIEILFKHGIQVDNDVFITALYNDYIDVMAVAVRHQFKLTPEMIEIFMDKEPEYKKTNYNKVLRKLLCSDIEIPTDLLIKIMQKHGNMFIDIIHRNPDERVLCAAIDSYSNAIIHSKNPSKDTLMYAISKGYKIGSGLSCVVLNKLSDDECFAYCKKIGDFKCTFGLFCGHETFYKKIYAADKLAQKDSDIINGFNAESIINLLDVVKILNKPEYDTKKIELFEDIKLFDGMTKDEIEKTLSFRDEIIKHYN